MVQAAAMMSQQPVALQLRFLQTVREISSEHNTTTFLPAPTDPSRHSRARRNHRKSRDCRSFHRSPDDGNPGDSELGL